MNGIKRTLFQKIRSCFYPVLVHRGSSAVNPVLDLYYYRGRWQLATADALYSDGTHYRPLRTAFAALKQALPAVRTVLVLGAGLGSAAQLLAAQGYHPAITLVDLDQQVLKWALDLMPPTVRKEQITPVCADADHFLDSIAADYDLIIVDVFEGRYVPPFVLGPAFLQQCRRHLARGGHLVLNYMVDNDQPEEKPKAALEAAFGKVVVHRFHLNRVFIATA